MIQLDREWYPDDDLELSQNRVVKQLKSLDTSKYLGQKILYFIVNKSLFISAEALTTVDEKYPYGKMKFIKNTILAFILILGVGVGVFLVDFVTDIQFSLDIQDKATPTQNFSAEVEKCRNHTENLNYEFKTTMNCFQPDSNQTEIFNCMNYLNKLQQEASKCFNRGQHFGIKKQYQFQYMRDNLTSHL